MKVRFESALLGNAFSDQVFHCSIDYVSFFPSFFGIRSEVDIILDWRGEALVKD